MTRFACVDAIGQPLRVGDVVVTSVSTRRIRVGVVQDLWPTKGWWVAVVTSLTDPCPGGIQQLEQRELTSSAVVCIGTSVEEIACRAKR